MDERERRRLLRHLTGQEPAAEPDPAYAVAEAIRAAWTDAIEAVADAMHTRLAAIVLAWGYDPEDETERVSVHIATAEEASRARVAHVVTVVEHAARDASRGRRAARFVGGYELVAAENGALAFQVNVTPTDHGHVVATADELLITAPAEA